MKHPGKVIVTAHWQHKNGATASLYGAVPWTGAQGNRETDWAVTPNGYNILWADGTVGCGRRPFATAQAAQEYLDKAAKRHKAIGGYSETTTIDRIRSDVS